MRNLDENVKIDYEKAMPLLFAFIYSYETMKIYKYL